MSRSIKDSDEEVDVKPGRRTRTLAGSLAHDSPLRRSSRIKLAVKQNDSSPESPLSDASSVNSSQGTRNMRRRTTAMDNSVVIEKSRALRSRRNSVASDISEVTESDVLSTPTKKSKGNNAANDVFSKANSRISRRFTRASSEAKSPPASSKPKVIRRTRASSMEPENTMEMKSTPTRSRRRTSMLPSEATVAEETENAIKVAVVALDRTLPNVKEINETEDKVGKSLSNVDEKGEEVTICVEEAHNNAANNSSNTCEDVQMDVPVDNEKVMPNINKNVEDSENSTGTVIEVESLAGDTSEVLVQNANQDTSKELGLKIENLLSNSLKDQDEDVSNKENQEVNICDSQSREATSSNVILQSPKPLFTSNMNTNKLIKETYKSSSETSLMAKRDYSKELFEVTDNTVVTVKEELTDTNDAVSKSVIDLNTSVNEDDGDSSDNMQKLTISTDTESLGETPLNESLDKRASPVETSLSLNLDSGNQIEECTENVNEVDSDMSTEVHNKQKESMQGTCLDGEYNEDTNTKMDVSASGIEQITNETNENSEKDNISPNIHTEDKSEIKDTEEETDTTKEKMEILLEPSEVSSVTINQSSIVTEDVSTAHNLQSTENANNLSTLVSTIPESSPDARANLENSTSINKNEDTVTDLVKSTSSSAVTETPAEATQEVPEKELSEKTTLLDDSSALREQSENKLQSNNKQEKSEENEELKESHENMEVDDEDSDTNTANLFQDISADEWKEKNADIDKESVHSMSTERLENESETDCDLVLVDRDAWLAAENIKAEKEKEVFDYDSDDTVVLKTRRDSLKALHEEKLLMETSKDESKMNISKSKTLNTSVRRKSIQRKKIEDKEDAEDGEDAEVDVEDTEDVATGVTNADDVVKGVTDANDVAEDLEDTEDVTQDTEETRNAKNVCNRKSMTKGTNEQSAVHECNVSVEKSVEEESLSEAHKTTKTTENLNKSSTNSQLNKSQSHEDIPTKRKSLNTTIQDTRDELEKSTRIESAKKRKSLNKSKHEDSEMIEAKSNTESVQFKAAKENEEDQCLNNSSKKRVKSKQLDANATETSDNESEISIVNKKKNSSLKNTRQFSTKVNVGSDSDTSRSSIDSEDSQNKTVKLPKFLFNDTSNSDSDNESESNKSIDSDIQREYNLHGEEICKFSDDDVPGDECRASETESSDPDDNGSDLMDFVVDDNEVEEGEEENEEEVESEEDEKDANAEESQSEKDEEAVETQDEEEVIEQEEEMQVDQEANEEDVGEKIVEEEEDQDEQKSVRKVNKSVDASNTKNKSRKSVDSDVLLITRNDKKEKRQSIVDVSLTEKNEKEHNLSNKSLSNSLKMKKTKQTRVSNEFADTMEQSLNESPLQFNKKMQKLNKSMECSTPKTSSSKQRLNITLNATDVSFETSRRKLSHGIGDVAKEKVQDTTLKMENSLKRLNKVKGKENLMHRSLPSELIELVEKTNVSKPVSSKVANLNRTTLIPYSESPTVKHLRKEKLNDSAPELKFGNNSRKSINNNTNNEQTSILKQIKEENVDVETPNVETTEKISNSLKEKLLKVADNILENEHKKKRTKQKKPAAEKSNSIQFIEENLEESIDSQITKKKQKPIVSANIVHENAVQVSVDEKKKKKKKKRAQVEVVESVQEELYESFTETKVETNAEIHNEAKKKKKKKETIQHVVDSQEPLKKKGKKEKKIVPCEEVPSEKLSKKKPKLLPKDEVSQSEQIPVETVPKKKKKKQKVPKDILQQEENSTEKLSKKRKKLLPKDTDLIDEEVSSKKLTKKEQKLLAANVPKNKEKPIIAAHKSQQSNSAASNSQDEALEMIKRASDSSVKVKKEKKKKRQKEHVERIQNEKEMKSQKVEPKSQVKKSNKAEVEKRSVKRLPDEILENLSDVPLKPLKKRKLSKSDDRVLPSRSMFESKTKGTKAVDVEDDFTSVSSYGGTTQFDVVNLQKIKKKRKTSEVISFRQKMLARNSRQPVSAYLMYLEKQMASGKDKFCTKP